MDTVLPMSDVHPRNRVAYWHEVACKTFVRHEGRITAPSTFDATLQFARLGDLGVVSIESRGLDSVERTKRSIAQGDDDVFLLILQVRGSATLLQDGRETVIHPGDFALLDAQRHYFCKYRDRKQITLKIPHQALKARLASSSRLTACPVRNSNALGALASSYISMIPHDSAVRKFPAGCSQDQDLRACARPRCPCARQRARCGHARTIVGTRRNAAAVAHGDREPAERSNFRS
ncbi:MAG TPA: hypothetical protein VIG38_13415 [Hyphomicrobium sp.]|jgi:hypothetical protein